MRFLMKKVASMFDVFGGYWLQELVNSLVTHVEHRKSVSVVNVSETKTNQKRGFIVVDEGKMNNLKILLLCSGYYQTVIQ